MIGKIILKIFEIRTFTKDYVTGLSTNELSDVMYNDLVKLHPQIEPYLIRYGKKLNVGYLIKLVENDTKAIFYVQLSIDEMPKS